jgi:hypothetical protein
MLMAGLWQENQLQFSFGVLCLILAAVMITVIHALLERTKWSPHPWSYQFQRCINAVILTDRIYVLLSYELCFSCDQTFMKSVL